MSPSDLKMQDGMGKNGGLDRWWKMCIRDRAWSQYPGAVDVWIRNWEHVAQLFQYGSAVRKILYTTNAVESVNSSFRKVTKKGAFPNENALLKLLYLRTVSYTRLDVYKRQDFINSSKI